MSSFPHFLLRLLMTIALMSCCSVVLTSCSAADANRQIELTGKTMGTGYNIKLVSDQHPVEKAQLQKQIQAELDSINASLSSYRPDSELSRFNASSTSDWQPVSAHFYTVLSEALSISQQSTGKFDVSVAPLVDLWGFGPQFGQDQIPSDGDIQLAMANVGYQHVQLDALQRLRKTKPQLHVDLSAIAKGYAVDRVANLLASYGYDNYLVEIGGELRASGKNARHDYWRIAVEKPTPGQRAVHRIISVHNMAVATSGDYRNFFELDGRRYSHAIDPTTGWPVDHSLVSVTVLAKTAMRADAWATAFLVMGADKSMQLAEKSAIPALFVLRNGDSFIDKSTQTMNNYVDKMK